MKTQRTSRNSDSRSIPTRIWDAFVPFAACYTIISLTIGMLMAYTNYLDGLKRFILELF